MGQSHRRLRQVLAFACLSLWALSLVVPAAGWGANQPPQPGWQILAIGWLGVFSLQFGWFANILLIPCIVLLLTDRQSSLVASLVIAIGIMALVGNAFFWTSAQTPDGDYAVVRGIGFYLWATSLIAAGMGLLISAFVEQDQRGDFG